MLHLLQVLWFLFWFDRFHKGTLSFVPLRSFHHSQVFAFFSNKLFAFVSAKEVLAVAVPFRTRFRSVPFGKVYTLVPIPRHKPSKPHLLVRVATSCTPVVVSWLLVLGFFLSGPAFTNSRTLVLSAEGASLQTRSRSSSCQGGKDSLI